MVAFGIFKKGHFLWSFTQKCLEITQKCVKTTLLLGKRALFVKHYKGQHPTTRCWFLLDYSLITPIWFSPISQALKDSTPLNPSTIKANNSTPKIKARTILAQNPGIQQLSQASATSVPPFDSFQKTGIKLYHLAFDRLWHLHDK